MSKNQSLQTQRKISSAFLMSSLFFGLSFLVMFIPFGLYSLAQTAATLGKRYAFLIMLFVFVVFFLVALFFQNFLFFAAALLILVFSPFFLISLVLREKNHSKALTACVLFMPLAFVFSSMIFFPIHSKSDLNQELSQLETVTLQKKNELMALPNTQVSEASRQELFAKYDTMLSSMNVLKNSEELNQFVAYSVWQRIVLFVLGSGSVFFFFGTFLCLANVVFLDMAYEQIENLKSIFLYVFKNASSFPADFIQVVLKLSQFMGSKLLRLKSIESHKILPSTVEMSRVPANVRVIRLSLFKPRFESSKLFFRGILFSLGKDPVVGWNTKNFSLPFPLAIASVLFMGAVLLWGGGSDVFLLEKLGQSSWAPVVSIGCMVSFVLLTVLALQGLFTLYLCVSNTVGLLLLCVFFVFGSGLLSNYYVLLAFLGSIALLDYVYDWRRIKRRSSL
jgi:hypothetical protein